jgi:NADH-quinone oxidoreductase subunit N
VVVATDLGARATAFYLAAYLAMNLAAFAVVIARERETGLGDDIEALRGLGASRPLLAWPMTIAMLSLAGIPATAGFIGKFFLIDASVDGGYAWLGVAIVVGSMVSLGYYLRVVAAMWLSGEAAPAAAPPVMAGGSPVADAAAPASAPAPASARAQPEVVGVALAAAAASLFFGIVPSPLFDLARGAGQALGIL